jgi:hypothetical protein
VFTRNLGSKRLRARTNDGRFKRATLADLGIHMTACAACGRFFENRTVDHSEPFPMPKRVTICPHCGREQE